MNVHSYLPAREGLVPKVQNAPVTGDKEARILAAAVRVFAEHGYHGSSMAAVAREAGVATGTTYLYFDRKQDLLVTLFQRHLTEYMARCAPILAAETPGVPRLHRLAEQHLAFFAEDRQLATVFQIHLREPDPLLAEGIRPSVAAYFDLIGDVIQAGVEAGAFAADLDVRLARQVFFGAMDEIVTGWLRAKRPHALMSALDPVATMLAQGFGATLPGDPS
ncbi:MAG TPA: TetR/AcrR family transcriptional regulator [Longimicrobiales bacterium]|nr:TetR/AcrR family transcriptional regulator [Longimicrobiales bacterium]